MNRATQIQTIIIIITNIIIIINQWEKINIIPAELCVIHHSGPLKK